LINDIWFFALWEEREIRSRFGEEDLGRGGDGGTEGTTHVLVQKILKLQFFLTKTMSKEHNHFTFRLATETKPDEPCTGKRKTDPRFQILTAVMVKTPVFWDMTSRVLAYRH
jgi:hypothetical protein